MFDVRRARYEEFDKIMGIYKIAQDCLSMV